MFETGQRLGARASFLNTFILGAFVADDQQLNRHTSLIGRTLHR
jgi:hypothetical protein